jgi:signal transduction histidine kinase
MGPISPDRDPASNRMRWVLLGAFTGLLALLVISGLSAVRILRQMSGQEQAVRHALARRVQTLSGLCLSVQIYNERLQRFVIEPTAEPDASARDQMGRLAADIDSSLRNYPSDREADEAAFLQRILTLLARHQSLFDEIGAMNSGERHRKETHIVIGEILPLRTQILQCSEKVNEWNHHRMEVTDEALLAQFGHLQSGLVRELGTAFGSGLLLVLVSMAYILRLERQTRSRYHELARSRQELQRLSSRLVDAQETERRSISRELHDEVGQSLGALLVDIGRLSAILPSERPEVKDQLDKMRSVAERTVQTVRNIALLLRPSMLDDLGLVAALEWQGREVSRRSEMEVEVQSENVSTGLPDEYKICIYRLVQEALTNAVRHSGAKNARVTVTQTASGIVVRVNDDGRGFDSKRTRGLGMMGMEERVKRLGGTFEIDSQPGRGTNLKAVLPPPV